MPAACNAPNTYQVHIWQADIAQMDPAANAQSLLSADEIERLSQFHFQKDRDCYVLTRALLRKALSSYFPDMAAKSWTFQKNKYGKPSLCETQGQPQLSFSISHSHGKIICAFSSSPSLGVDLEIIDRNIQFSELAKTYFSDIEYQNLMARNPDQRGETFYRYWTLKESFIKAKGQGLSLPLNQFTFDFENLDAIQIQFHGPLSEDKTKWQFQLFEPWPQSQAALALASDHPLEILKVASSLFAT